MFLHIIGTLLQLFGILIPAVGILGLFVKRGEQASPSLLLTNVGCLVMNGGFLLFSYAWNADAARMAMNLQYIGNILFFDAFLLFVLSYLEMDRAKWFFAPWLTFEAIVLRFYCMEGAGRAVFRSLTLSWDDRFRMMYRDLTGGPLYLVRNSMLTFLLVILLVLTTRTMFRTKARRRRNMLARIAGAEFVIVVSMNYSLLVRPVYDILPLFAALSILSIVQGIVKGKVFSVIDSGKEWLLDNIQSAFIVTDPRYGYQDANAYARELFPALAGLKKNRAVPEQVRELVENGEKQVRIGDAYYEKSVREILEDGDLQGYGLLLLNVTEQNRLRKEAESARDEAKAASESKSAFLSSMSHEIRTPMNAIVGMTDILLREDLPGHVQEYLGNIKSSGDALLSIINDILDFSKIEAGKLEILEEEYEPMSLLNDVSMIFLNRIGEKPVELLYDIAPGMPSKLWGDAKRIRQVLINIMNNAVKFTDEGSVRLAVTCEGTGSDMPGGPDGAADGEGAPGAAIGPMRLRFSVEDTGQGIREEDIGKLFGTFSQVDTRKNRSKEGTGLGLAICRQLVELMGGEIGVESTYGEGSRFWFTLPQRVVDGSPAARVKDPAGISYLGGRFAGDAVRECFEALAARYGLAVRDGAEGNGGPAGSGEASGGRGFFFTDLPELLSGEERESLRARGVELCVLQNPMTQNYYGSGMTVVNKPLYSLNFCQVLNGEGTARGAGEPDGAFTAPDARILVVDDNEMNLKVARGLLAPLEVQVDEARDGKEALEAVQGAEYDLVLLDHMMPVMDGVEAAEAIRALGGEEYRRLPLIALSANATAEARKLFLEHGFDDFVAKPVRMAELRKCLAKWLPDAKIKRGAAATAGEEAHTGAGAPGGDAARATGRQGGADTGIPEQGAPLQAAAPDGALPEIEGINTATGMMYAETRELYVQLLGDFAKLIDKKAKKIEECLADGLVRDVTIEVHALKSTSRFIGAEDLSKEFEELEALGKREDLGALRREAPAVLAHYRAFKGRLGPFAEGADGGKQTVSDEKLAAVLGRLRDAMDGFDLDGADAAMKELSGYAVPEGMRGRVEDLDSLVADVAMEDCVRLAEELIAELEKRNG